MRSLEGQKHILLLDDDPISRAVFRKVLRSRHYHVTEAATGGEALRILRHAPWDFDLLIADCILDDSDGLEVASQARQYRPDLPVLLTSGTPHTEFGDLADPLEFLAKPFRAKALESMVERLLAPSHSALQETSPEAAVW